MFYRRLAAFCILGLLFSHIALAQQDPVFQARALLELSEPVWGLQQVQTQLSSIQQPLAVLTNPGKVLLIDTASAQYQELYISGNTITFMSDSPTIDAGLITGSNTQDIVFCDSKTITVLTQTSTGWTNHTLYDLSGMTGVLWGARVGDLIAGNPGDEVLGIIEGVFDSSFANVYQYNDSQWSETTVYQAEVGMDSAIGDLNSARPGNEFVIVTEMGPTYTLHEPVEGWDPSMNPPIDGYWGQVKWPISKVSDDIEQAGWVSEIGDVDPDAPGNEIVYGNRYNNMISVLTSQQDAGYLLQQVFKGNWAEQVELQPGNIWDLAIGDVLPNSPGHEIVGVDDTGSVYLVWKVQGQWRGETVYQSNAPLFAVEIMDADLSIPGDEIVVGGQNNQVIVLSNQTSGIDDWLLMQ